VLRSVLFLLLLALAACATAADTKPEMQFVLADPNKYKTDAEKERALTLAKIDCKAKAMAASAALEKSIASEHHSRENLDKAREKAAEMYTTSYTLCMLNAGYMQK